MNKLTFVFFELIHIQQLEGLIRHLQNCYDLCWLRDPEVFCKKGVLKNFAVFTGKHLCWSLFLIELQAFRPAALLNGYTRYLRLLVKPGPVPWTSTQKNLDPKKPRPWKIWTLNNLDPEKSGLWKTWILKNIDSEKHGINMSLKNMSDFRELF